MRRPEQKKAWQIYLQKGEVIYVGHHSWLELGPEKQQSLEYEELREWRGLAGAPLKLKCPLLLPFPLVMLET